MWHFALPLLCKVNQFSKVLNHATDYVEQRNLILFYGVLIFTDTRKTIIKLEYSRQIVSDSMFVEHL